MVPLTTSTGTIPKNNNTIIITIVIIMIYFSFFKVRFDKFVIIIRGYMGLMWHHADRSILIFFSIHYKLGQLHQKKQNKQNSLGLVSTIFTDMFVQKLFVIS